MSGKIPLLENRRQPAVKFTFGENLLSGKQHSLPRHRCIDLGYEKFELLAGIILWIAIPLLANYNQQS
jgi:hypothetical protein